jgi:hypothetical protein
MFRVAAENEVGVGEFVDLPKAVVPKSQHGEWTELSPRCLHPSISFICNVNDTVHTVCYIVVLVTM